MNIHNTVTLDEFEKLVRLPEMDAEEDLQEVYRAADGIAAATFVLLAPIPSSPFHPCVKEGLVNAAYVLSRKITDDLARLARKDKK